MKTINTLFVLAILLVVSACDCSKKSCEQPKDCKAGCAPGCR